MRISDRYIGKQVLLGTLYAVVVLGVVLVLGNLFKQIQPLLVDLKAPPRLVLWFVINVLPLSLMYTIPWGFLSAVLLVFGRMSSQQEITSFRVAGISLFRLAAPVFVIGALLSVLSLWLNNNVVPQSKATIRQLLYKQAVRDPESLLKPGVVQGDLQGNDTEMQKILIEGKSDGWVDGFHFYSLPKADLKSPDDKKTSKDLEASKDSTAPMDQGVTYIHAARASFKVDSKKNQLIMKLQDAYAETRKQDGTLNTAYAYEAEPIVFSLKEIKEKRNSPKTLSNQEIRDAIAADPTLKEEKKIEMRAEITKRYSFSMASFAFAFIAIPLGLQARRRDNSHGLILSLLIGTGYFLITVMADQFKTDLGATLTLWSPNAACMLLGLFLFRRAKFR